MTMSEPSGESACPGTDYPLHPDHGPHDPVEALPRPRGPLARRTTWIDLTRPAGAATPLQLDGTGCDLRIDEHGVQMPGPVFSLSATVDVATTQLLALDSHPRRPELADLPGRSVMRGFRGAFAQADPTARDRRDPLDRMLDDLPVVTLISGHAVTAAGLVKHGSQLGYAPVPDQCAGFAEGGPFMAGIAEGRIEVPTGPQAPGLTSPDLDAMAPARLQPQGMRRQRWLDLGLGHDENLMIHAMFRDTYVRGDGVETIIHEYTLDASIEHSSGVIRSAKATPRVLPWQACPLAAASVDRIVGTPVAELDERVRGDFRGVSTCTHLNDLVRSLSDVPALLHARL